MHQNGKRPYGSETKPLESITRATATPTYDVGDIIKISVRKFVKGKPRYQLKTGAIVHLGKTSDRVTIETKRGERVSSRQRYIKETVFSISEFGF